MGASKLRRYFVASGHSGGWLIFREGTQRAVLRVLHKGTAVETAKTIAHDNAPSEVIVERRDGSFAVKYSFGPGTIPAF